MFADVFVNISMLTFWVPSKYLRVNCVNRDESPAGQESIIATPWPSWLFTLNESRCVAVRNGR
jgi:hypothetical protein